MARVTCVDGRRLDVVPEPVLDRTGAPYETTLRLLLDGVPFGSVGQRCAGLLAALLDGDPAPGPGELLDLRTRDPDDPTAAGELRVRLDVVRTWTGSAWQARTDAVVQAWGDGGAGVRAVLDPAGLRSWLTALRHECDAAGAGRAG